MRLHASFGGRLPKIPLMFVSAVIAAACGDNVPGRVIDGGADAIDDAGPWIDPNGCSELFRHDVLPSYYVTISAENLAAMEDEFRAPYPIYQQTGVWPELTKTYRPLIEFRYGEVTVADAQIRLKGRSSWRHTIELDGTLAKMQFVVSFNEANPSGRFFGERKLEFDMPRNDASMLRARIGLEYLRRDLQVPAQCAVSARLYINGEYYGLFAAIERLDKEFLQRNFTGPGDDDGDLWDGGNELKTNETTATRVRRDQLYAAANMTQVTALADMTASVRVWAGGATMPDGDGYYGGTHNYFLYDHPTRGFVWLPHDLDSSMSYRRYDIGPMFWSRDEQPALHYLMVMNDPTWRANYVDALCQPAWDAYNVEALQARVDAWSAQIADAADADPHFRFSHTQWQAAVNAIRTEVAQRKQFIAEWCDCYANGGTDGDGDGTPWCRDVADNDATVHLGAAEFCGPDPIELEPLDDDCDGSIDEGC